MKVIVIILCFFVFEYMLRKLLGAETRKNLFEINKHFSKTFKRIEMVVLILCLPLLVLVSDTVSALFLFFTAIYIVRGIEHLKYNREAKEHIFYILGSGFYLILSILIGIEVI